MTWDRLDHKPKLRKHRNYLPEIWNKFPIYTLPPSTTLQYLGHPSVHSNHLQILHSQQESDDSLLKSDVGGAASRGATPVWYAPVPVAGLLSPKFTSSFGLAPGSSITIRRACFFLRRGVPPPALAMISSADVGDCWPVSGTSDGFISLPLAVNLLESLLTSAWVGSAGSDELGPAWLSFHSSASSLVWRGAVWTSLSLSASEEELSCPPSLPAAWDPLRELLSLSLEVGEPVSRGSCSISAFKCWRRCNRALS